MKDKMAELIVFLFVLYSEVSYIINNDYSAVIFQFLYCNSSYFGL